MPNAAATAKAEWQIFKQLNNHINADDGRGNSIYNNHHNNINDNKKWCVHVYIM